MQFKTMVINALLFGLFMLALYSFFDSFTIGNGVHNPMNDKALINASLQPVLHTLTTASDQANSSLGKLEDETSHPTLTLIGFVFDSILHAGTTFLAIVVNITFLPFTLLSSYVGASLVASVLTAIVVIGLILSLWRLWRAGE